MLALAAEALLEIFLGNVARVVDVKVVEGKEHVGLCDCLSAVDGHSKELRVVDLSIVIEVDALKHLVDFILRHIQFVEGGPDLAQLESARVVGVEGAEGIAKSSKVEGSGVRLVHKESQSLNLQTLRLAEVFDATKNREFVFMQQMRVVTSVVRLDVV